MLEPSTTNMQDNNSMGDSITKKNSVAAFLQGNKSQAYACKVVERRDLCQTKEGLIVSEIQNQDSVASKYVVKMRKAIKTDSRYYIFMEYCNGSDLKEVMELKGFKIDARIIQRIMHQLVHGFNDMMSVLVIHRDLKL